MRVLMILLVSIILFGKELIPLYSYPNKQWSKIKDAIVIINVNNGPGFKINNDYSKYINILKQNGNKVIGYVYTKYGKRNKNIVKYNISKWAELYPIDGIFFDEADLNNNFDYYLNLRSFMNDLYGISILNAGTNVPQKIINKNIFDIIITFEDSEIKYTKPINVSSSKTKIAALIHSAKNNNLNLNGYDYSFSTKDTLPNPWDNN